MLSCCSLKDDVLRLQGTRSYISRSAAFGIYSCCLHDARLMISTRTNRVIEWDDEGNLKVKLEPGRNVSTATFFTRGSHKDDVLRLPGTPSDISRYSALGYELWRSGYSSLTISIRTKRVIDWDDEGNLKV